jgi:hypothetical protein
VLDERISGTEVHNALQGFRAKRKCGTGMMEAKLVQQLVLSKSAPSMGS